jgi:hypothetical protein
MKFESPVPAVMYKLVPLQPASYTSKRARRRCRYVTTTRRASAPSGKPKRFWSTNDYSNAAPAWACTSSQRHRARPVAPTSSPSCTTPHSDRPYDRPPGTGRPTLTAAPQSRPGRRAAAPADAACHPARRDRKARAGTGNHPRTRPAPTYPTPPPDCVRCCGAAQRS